MRKYLLVLLVAVAGCGGAATSRHLSKLKPSATTVGLAGLANRACVNHEGVQQILGDGAGQTEDVEADVVCRDGVAVNLADSEWF